MKEKTQKQTGINLVKWAFVIMATAIAVYANAHYANEPISLRLIAWLVFALAMLGVAVTTQEGVAVLSFAQESRAELRKVVWPTREQTVRMSGVVIAMILSVGMVLWGLDTLLFWCIGLLTGQRG